MNVVWLDPDVPALLGVVGVICLAGAVLLWRALRADGPRADRTWLHVAALGLCCATVVVLGLLVG